MQTIHMNPKDFKRSREALGFTQETLAATLRSDPRSVRRWEGGERKVPGPVSVLMELLVSIKHQAEAAGITPAPVD